MAMRGMRGATTVAADTEAAIWQAAQEMVTALLQENAVASEDIGACICSMTEDLTAAFPTAGLRQLPGFDAVPLFDARQCAVTGSLPRCPRVLLLVDTDKKQRDIRHVYLHDAVRLRPDIAQN